MKTFFEHVEHLRGKPHATRRQIALGGALGGAALIGVVWLAGTIYSGTFYIQGSSFAESTEQGTTLAATDTAAPDNSNLLGAASAAASAASAGGSAPQIEIVSTATSSTLSKTSQPKAEQTVIPF